MIAFRIAAALLQTIPKALFQLGQQLDSSFAAGVLDGLVFVDHRATATAQTLAFVRQRMLTPLQGRRPGAETLVVVMLGSESQDGLANVQQAAADLHGTGAIAAEAND